MNNHNEDKKVLVNTVFSKVYKKYDLMNDLMSLGVHRIWKRNMLDWMKPQENQRILDVASGTGDLAKIFSEKNNNKNQIDCVEPNKHMIEIGKNKLKNYKNIKWFLAPAEKLPFNDNTFDFYTISYGIRNVTDIDLCLKEAFRVLKTGGRFMCLEFSKIENEILEKMYKQYSRLIPAIGNYVTGSAMPYTYLVESIEKFYNQEELLGLIKNTGFSDTEFRNLSNGISAIHSGWKI
ncbi:bifunctional demethylmenaquinone methyltransferase/2-methoxy-6-polyprenyl-1,4-benzoquinol methylase UbiE [Pelagibacteraceae bacterium]|jgi:demethylmenaquinone methyltransferase/2-methoxy-6-polyprenyl-1,4-benzoquinol methylase|nr:bifunctional demethylmenaquinone methyltransferase/2-methoxy-6-polyprenyl-1,4-benzoquinol methylase UbiE [Pelagibacteraceae bacterium]|tara:strand:- start:1983 stop:2687 length:705 start_codon:yes stop_codon:yes gene_type:complete